MSSNLPLRERKKYQTMTNILEEFITSLEEKNFHEIVVEDICDRASISKVTFFRYFRSKEEVLDYFVLRWCYQRSIEIGNKTHKGLEGIYHVFKSAAEIPNAEKIFVALINYYSKLTEKPNDIGLSEAASYVISNNLKDGVQVGILSLKEIISYYIQQLDNLTEEKKSNYTEHLLSLFYGVPFQVHIQMLGTSQLNKAYKLHLDLLFKKSD